MATPRFDFPFIAKHWHRRTGFFALLLVILGIEATLLISQPLVLLPVAIATVLLIELVWQFSRALPKTKRGKVGFVICITCDDEKEAAKIRSDFVVTLRRLIKNGRSGGTFQVMEIPPHHSETVLDTEEAQKLRIRTRAHFVLYGRVRLGNVRGKPHHFVELDGAVSHQPIPMSVSGALAQEFSELLPRKVLIAAEDDLFAFQFTSEWAELVAKYIIGIAAALSRDLKYAEQLYREVLDRLRSVESNVDAFGKLRERLPKRISELYVTRASRAYEQWAGTHDPAALEQLGEFLAHIDPDLYPSTHVFNLNAIHVFLEAKSVARAIDWLHKIQTPSRDALWNLNVGFLLAYAGDLRGAIKHYRRALEQPIPVDVIAKIEDFLYYFATSEPEMYQLFYCLGFFNWKFKGDLVQAEKDFGTFVERRLGSEYEKEAKLATKWLAQLEKSSVRLEPAKLKTTT